MEQISSFEFIRFRNPGSTPILIFQCFMLVSAILIIAALIYITVLVVAMVVHHLLYDKDPKHVPTYVKRAVQFDNDSDSDVEATKSRMISAGLSTAQMMEDKEDRSRTQSDIFSTATTKKLNNLDKFMKTDLDVNNKK